jgi:hypothetical protein
MNDHFNDLLEALQANNRCRWCSVKVPSGADICSECYPEHMDLWNKHIANHDALVEKVMEEERRYTEEKREFHKRRLATRASEPAKRDK